MIDALEIQIVANPTGRFDLSKSIAHRFNGRRLIAKGITVAVVLRHMGYALTPAFRADELGGKAISC